MKHLAFFSVFLTANAAVLDYSTTHNHEKRQGMAALPIGLMSFLMSSLSMTPKPAVQNKKLTASMFPQAVREQVLWGPFTLQPTAGQHRQYGLKLDKQSDVLEQGLEGLCKDCMVLQARAEITDKDGKRLDLKDGVYVHHIIVADLGRKMIMPPLMPSGFSACPGGAKGGKGAGGFAGMSGMGGMTGMGMGSPKLPSAVRKRSPQFGGGLGFGGLGAGLGAGLGGGLPGGLSLFIGKGNEGDSSTFAPINSTVVKSGFWIGKTDKITATAEVVNYKDTPRDVYFSIDLEYLPFSSHPAEYLDVGFGAIPLEQCGNLFLHPPADKMVTYNSSIWNVAGNGYLINLSPHLHDGALNMKIFLNDKLVCQSDAVYGEDGGTSVNGEKWETITSYTPCVEPVKIKTGDKVVMSTDYDLRKHRLRPDSKDKGMEAEAMAIANYQFAQSK